MKRLLRAVKYLGLLVILAIFGLASPVVYVETMCRGDQRFAPYAAIVDPAHHRAESRTLMTYPEWHIVHAYDDYARVITKGDPHEFGYLQAIGGFWSSLCNLSRESARLGDVDQETKQMVYVIGVSFTAELMLKAAYEETFGRIAAALRGATRAPLDDLSAQQATSYATFLQQVPWYKWQFAEDAAALDAAASSAFRDKERRFALGLEYRSKAAYAKLIAAAVSQTGADALTLRMIVSDVTQEYLSTLSDVQILSTRPEGIEIEVPRYRALTDLLVRMASDGANFVEIAGNDDIMFTALSDRATKTGALLSLPRQGAADYRHLMLVKVSDLANQLRQQIDSPLRLEHIHDY